MPEFGQYALGGNRYPRDLVISKEICKNNGGNPGKGQKTVDNKGSFLVFLRCGLGKRPPLTLGDPAKPQKLSF